MTIDQHPELEVLLAYSREPSHPNYVDIRSHILVCDECKEQVDQLHTLKSLITTEGLESKAVESGVTINEIADYSENKLDDEERAKLTKLIDENQAVKAEILHYSLHSQTMKSAGIDPDSSVAKTRQAENNKKTSLLDLLKPYFQWQMPAWVGVPVMASLLALLLIPSSPQHQTQPTVVAYQDEANIIFRDKNTELPGIGFFSESRTKKKFFSGLQADWKNSNQIHLSWQAIPNAQDYTLELFQIVPDGKHQVFSKTVPNSTVKINAHTLENNKPYEWLITGKTADTSHFEIRGGLVIQR